MEDLFAGRVKFENPSSKNPGSMKDSLTGLDRYEVFLKKLQKAIDDMGDRRIVIVYTDIRWATRSSKISCRR